MEGIGRVSRRQSLHLLIVFFLTGLWHGAGWTFVVWGGVHGVLVLVNHIWTQSVRSRLPPCRIELLRLFARTLSRLATLLLVVCLWVVFRATSWATAIKVLKAMFVPVPTGARAFPDLNLYPVVVALLIVWGVVVVLFPNSLRIVHRLRHGRIWLVPGSSRAGRVVGWRRWMPALVTGGALYFAVASIGSVQSKFIYFNF